MVLLEGMRHRIAYSDLALVSEICLAGVSRCELVLEEVSDDVINIWMSVSGICCESGLRFYVVSISKSDVVLISTRVVWRSDLS
ncbi:hypothetical protein F511_16046 [Dorcoceras hygrometricum]|uniref:Uncharacterized protein n=1 Tax=Dorcoceras hygrometricum TaxID=472368 RepID=A0A2Z7A5F2_9LAMI|nr:hypothetical protein F511_42533 [Dorcoceras hygrometricum]KZV30159.1 hypothetical protein F511_16046 [Dorcoceras hygrometricum]